VPPPKSCPVQDPMLAAANAWGLSRDLATTRVIIVARAMGSPRSQWSSLRPWVQMARNLVREHRAQPIVSHAAHECRARAQHCGAHYGVIHVAQHVDDCCAAC
jgi:hypothetical protein